MRKWNVRRLWLLPAALAILLSGCSGAGYEHELYVENSTGQQWLIRSSVTTADGPAKLVVSIAVGGHGPAAMWNNDMPEIELLDVDCTVVGLFAVAGANSYVVAGYPGISGSVYEGGSYPMHGGSSGVSSVGNCGGVGY